jgi:hypothetical protein
MLLQNGSVHMHQESGLLLLLLLKPSLTKSVPLPSEESQLPNGERTFPLEYFGTKKMQNM